MGFGTIVAGFSAAFVGVKLIMPARTVLGARWGNPLPGHLVSGGWGESRPGAVGGKHFGLDIAAPTGTRVRAALAGVVTRADSQDDSTTGKWVRIETATKLGPVRTRYLHLHRVLVKRGDVVAVGDHIGEVGCTGACHGPHLHIDSWGSAAFVTEYLRRYGIPSPAIPSSRTGLGRPIPLEAVLPVDGYTSRVIASAQQRSIPLRVA